MPFVSIVDKIPELAANAEVEKIFHIPLPTQFGFGIQTCTSPE